MRVEVQFSPILATSSEGGLEPELAQGSFGLTIFKGSLDFGIVTGILPHLRFAASTRSLSRNCECLCPALLARLRRFCVVIRKILDARPELLLGITYFAWGCFANCDCGGGVI